MTNTQREWKERFQERFDKDTVPYESENGIVLDEFFVMADLDELTDFIQKEIEAARAEGAAAEKENNEKADFLAIKALADTENHGKHHFTESVGGDKFYRVLFCVKCGVVSWNFNFAKEPNKELQEAALKTKCATPTKDKGEDVSSNNTV